MQGQLHSKAQVMQSYLSAQEPTTARPVSKPHSSSSNTALTAVYNTHITNHPNSPTTDHVTAADAVSKPYSDGSTKIPSRVYTTPTPSQRSEVLPCLSRVGVSPMASDSNTDKAYTPTAAAARNPGQLVQVKRNVWLPWAVVQQAGGDADLALHLAAQDKTLTDSHDSFNSSPTAGKAWTPASITSKPRIDSSFLPRQEMGQKENDNCNYSRGAEHAAYAPWVFNSQQMNNDGMIAGAHHPLHYGSGKMQSHFHSAMSLKSDNAANCNDGLSKFDPTIQPPGLYTYPSQGMEGAHTVSQTTASKQGNGYEFKSPTASLPTMGSSNAFVSPQCVMDNNNSLFSYTVATPEQTMQSRPPTLFATPDTHPTHGWGAPPAHNPPVAYNPAAYCPELNPSATHLHMGQAYSMGGFSGMHGIHTGAGPGAGGYLGRPWQEGKTYQVMTQYGASPEAHNPHSNIAAGMGCNTTGDGHSGDRPTHQH